MASEEAVKLEEAEEEERVVSNDGCPEAPVFYPTSKEWSDPQRYIEGISDQVRPYGICKIVPPSSWKPPFQLDQKSFGFRTRVQQINFLDGQARLRLTFVENLCRFWAKRGTPLERLPIVEYRVVELCSLFREVVKRGGHAAVSEAKKWSEVARSMGMTAAAGGALRQHYTRILLPYELHKKEMGNKADDDDGKDPAANGADGAEGAKGGSADFGKEDKKEEGGDGAGGDAAPANAAGSDKGKEKGADQERRSRRSRGSAAAAAAAVEAEVKAEGGASATTTEGSAKGKEGESKDGEGVKDGEDEEESDDDFTFGYHDGNKYTLKTYKEMADAFKAQYFQTDEPVPEETIEKEYWDIVTNGEKDVKIEYGSELHSTLHGSGFPTSGNSLNPLDSSTGSTYSRSPWNLCNLNAHSLLRYVKEDIPGVISPWIYVGMCFSTFCWHYEDHFLYSINYLWEGSPKLWYGVPGDEAELFEAAMKAYAPELFDQQPDLLFHLVTMISPKVLMEKGVNVCRCVQRAGEVMLTFPRAYHGGLNTGYNVAESCNFAVTDWIPWGWLSDQTYRQFGKAHVFSLPGLLFSLAEDDDSVQTAMWLLPDIVRYTEIERGALVRLRGKGLTDVREMDKTKAGILTKVVAGEQQPAILQGKRARKPRVDGAGGSRQVVTGMDEIRRARDDDEFVDECCICRASTFLALVRCPNCKNIVSCCEHAEEMCSCPISCKFIERRYTDEYISRVIEGVTLRAGRPAIWREQAASLLEDPPPAPEERYPLRSFQILVTECERFPRFLTWAYELRGQLKEHISAARGWSARASGSLQAAKDYAKRAEKDPEEEASVTSSDLRQLLAELTGSRIVQEDAALIAELADSVEAWRSEARDALDDGKLTAEGWLKIMDKARAIGVSMPEAKRVQSELRKRVWRDTAAESMKRRIELCELRGLVADADANRYQVPEVAVLRECLQKADVYRSKITKVRERGTTVAALQTLLDGEEKDIGMDVLIQEVSDARAFLDTCDDWKARAKEALEGSSPLPAMCQLEKLSGEYKLLGVYIDVHDGIASRLQEAKSWLSKARKTCGTMLLWNIKQQQQQQGGGPPPQASQAGDDALAAEAVDGVVVTAGGDQVLGLGEGKRKRESAGGSGVDAKKAKKGEMFEPSTERLVFWSKPLPPLSAVKELVAEGEKLRAGVEEYDVMKSCCHAHEDWLSTVTSIPDSAPLQHLFDAYHTGIQQGIDVGEPGKELMVRIWSTRVKISLTSGEATPEQLAVLQAEAKTLGVPAEGDLAQALVAADSKANPITCFCKALLKGTPSLSCRQCGLSHHQPCLAMSAKDFAASGDSYVCAPCKRENLRGQQAAMPPGWDDFVDPSGRPIYIHLSSKKTSWDMPPGTVRAGGDGRLAFVSNPSVERIGDKMCHVCFQDEGEEGAADVLSRCVECGISVHPPCYGIEATPDRSFTCKACENGVRNLGCPLCPLPGGAVKPCSSGGWAHIVCAMYVPETSFDDAEIMEPISGVPLVNKDRKRIKCSVCKTAKGAVVQCDHPGCKMSWHPLCGIEEGWYMSMSEDETGEDVITICKCPKHRPEEDDEDDKLYCLCQQKYVEGEVMLACEKCDEWYHPKCLGISEEEAEKLDNWICSRCVPSGGEAAASPTAESGESAQKPQAEQAEAEQAGQGQNDGGFAVGDEDKLGSFRGHGTSVAPMKTSDPFMDCT